MAVARRAGTVTRRPLGGGRFVAVDGVNGDALLKAAREELARGPRPRHGGISHWDASGVFGDLVVPGHRAGYPSARTLLLLYAADLAFRLRWEIRPALAEGQTVVAVPYVATAVAFGRAAGLPAKWVNDVFGFAQSPDRARTVGAAPPRSAARRCGFFEFACERLAARAHGPCRRELVERARLLLAD